MSDIKILVERSDMVAIADAVRSKTDTTDEMTIGEIINGINNIHSGASDIEEWDGSYEEISSGYTVTLKFTATNNISYTVDDGETITIDVTSDTEIPLQVSSSLKIKANTIALDYNNESNLNVTTWNTPNATWAEGIYTITEDCTITLGYSGIFEPI